MNPKPFLSQLEHERIERAIATAERKTSGEFRVVVYPEHAPDPVRVAEALACGTPVIAYDRGSMRELIDDGVTGYVVSNIHDAVAAVDSARSLDRSRIREIAVTRFEQSRLVDAYINVYRNVLGRTA